MKKMIATTTTEEEIFSRTENEYKAMDKALNLSRKLFDDLTALQELGKYGTEEWKALFEKYAIAFKKANGYRPHWVR